MNQADTCPYCSSTDTTQTYVGFENCGIYIILNHRCKACKQPYKVVLLKWKYAGKQKLIGKKWVYTE